MQKGDVVWLGTPVKLSHEELSSSYTSRIGGKAVLFRESEDYTMFCCPNCKEMNKVSLLAQIYAPLGVYDRVLYVLICAACSNEQSSFCFSLRSQNFNQIYVPSLQSTNCGGSTEKDAFFWEDTDWGDGMNEENTENKDADIYQHKNKNNIVNASSEVAVHEVYASEKSYPLVCSNLGPPIKGVCYPCFGLDIFEEPSKSKNKYVAHMEQLHEARQRYGDDVVDITIVAEDNEPEHEKRLRKYIERIGRVPSQCVRWGPSKKPLRSSIAPITVPHCPICGHERRYEFQLTSPIIYFLTKNRGEKSHFLHFCNIIVFTCSINCNTKAYASEYCFVEEEI